MKRAAARDTGLSSAGAGVLLGLVLLIQAIVRWIVGGSFASGFANTAPWWVLMVLTFLASAQFFVMGLLGELVTRSWHESTNEIYLVRRIVERN